MDYDPFVWECEYKALKWHLNKLNQILDETQDRKKKTSRDDLRSHYRNFVDEFCNWLHKHREFDSEKDYLEDCKKRQHSLAVSMNQHDREQARFVSGDATPKTPLAIYEAEGIAI